MNKMSYPSLVLLLVLIFVTMRSIAGVIEWLSYVDPQITLEHKIDNRSILVNPILECKIANRVVMFKQLPSGEIVYWCGGTK